MLEPAEVLSYLAHTSSLGDICDVSLSNAALRWTISIDELRSGGLSSHLTREILLAYSTRYPEVPFGSVSIPMVCCIRSLSFKDPMPDAPLLCMGITLDPNGSLLPQKGEFGTWIPRSALATNELYNKGLVVCDIDTYRAHQVAMASLPDDDSWNAALQRAEDLFASVCSVNESVLASAGAQLVDSSCTLWIWERPEDAVRTSNILARLAHTVDDSAKGDTIKAGFAGEPFYKLTLEESATHNRIDALGEQLPDEALQSHKLICGVLDHIADLGQREHEVLATYARQQKGDVLTISTPKGTNCESLTLAMTANILTNSALRGDPAPFMCCVAPPHVLQKLVDILSDRPLTGQVALGSRWIPRISRSRGVAGDTAADKKILGPLPALCMVHTASGVELAPSNMCLTNAYCHEGGGELADYRDGWYIPKATTYFLDCVSGFARQRYHSIGQARARLADQLRRIDQERCELIDAYANVCRASELLKRRDDLVARIGRLRRGHTVCKERLEFWQRLAQESRPKRQIMGSAEQDQSVLIAKNTQKGESLAQNKSQIADICEAYNKEILRIETSIDRLRGAAANLNARIRAAEPEGTRCSNIIDRLTELCKLTQEQKGLLDALIDGRGSEVSLTILEKALDKTVRPAEFWLAIHIFESLWISYAHRNADRLRARKENMEDLWANASSICPINLIPDTIAVGVLQRITSASGDLAPVTFVLDASSMDIAKGLAISSLSQRMVVMGNLVNFGVLPSQGSTFDELQCVSHFGSQVWELVKEQKVAASSGHSFYEAARKSSNAEHVSLNEVGSTYGEIVDFRNDLFWDEKLKTNRIPANSADDNGYALHGIVPSLSYVLVPDSAWKQDGGSRSNRSEALALGRWLNNHAKEIVESYDNGIAKPVAIVSPFYEQTCLVKEVVNGLENSISLRIDVHTLCNLNDREYPLVILCATCGPQAFENLGVANARHILAVSAASANDALVLFCGGVWIRSTNDTASKFFAHATKVGRLFSSPRSSVPSSSTEDKARKKVNVNLRSKPLSITALIKALKERGDISSVPSATAVNRALADVGLIERVRLDGGRSGWRPTAAGREVGIVAIKDRNGNPFCAYPKCTEPVVATVVQTLEVEEKV